jgi:hypothetical protein
MYSLAKKCMQLKPMTSSHILIGLVIGIIGDNTEVSNVNQTLVVYILCYLNICFSFLLNSVKLFEMVQVVLAECSRSFGPW